MWKTRNDLLFQNICLSPDVCCTKATDMLQEYHKVWISPSTSPSARTNAKWEPPNQGVLKVNFDAAINLDYGRVGIGIVTRDMQGKVVFASSKTLLQRWGPEMGEAAAALVAIKVAKEQGWKDIVLEGDACTIIRALKGSQQRGSHVQLMVEDARSIMPSFDSISFSFCFRECDEVAHRLAKQAVSNFSDEVWLDGGPLWISDVLVFDTPDF
ncbi:uncharacterized protein [Spinacia oleracea]|uniref:RNase H type-1 domain-containing protein n=1 Tax=Spinacia oleracea TaxID=3562 RepID=A0A9R0HY16_SPIOL|nr:uncharacterized protein LOC110778879 [Spinacia oleracea]